MPNIIEVPFEGAQENQRSSGFVAALVLLTLIGGGAGAGLAKYVADYTEEEVHGRLRQQQSFTETLPFSPSTRLQTLEPLVTNLASPQDAWIRLQASILLEDDPDGDVGVLKKKVEDDFLGYMRTLTLSHLEGDRFAASSRRSHRARSDTHQRSGERSHSGIGGYSMSRLLVAGLVLVAMTGAAAAQVPDLSALLPAGEGSASGRIIQMIALLTVLSLAPGILIMVTSFTRFVIAFSFLRSGIGLQTTPGNLILISLALFMTFYVMAPTFDKAWEQGVQPLMNNEISEEEAYVRITTPFRDFMLSQVREEDLVLFDDLAAGRVTENEAASAEEVELRVLIPAFMISELRRGFEIGFLIALPFLVIDMIVATITMSMGMMMLPPTVISLPFKALFFVLIDGWNLLVGSLVRSFL